MKFTITAAALAGLLVFAAQAAGGRGSEVLPESSAATPSLSWSDFGRSFGTTAARPAAAAKSVPAPEAAEIDVVDAHWMALTMWGEARGSGEDGMRAVGHVIANRRQLGGRHGAFVTDTVSEAWQFSCWNPGDPNLAAMQNVEALPHAGRDYRLWLAAKRIAAEILAGQSEDPTRGALFYHADYVAPGWAAGVPPVSRIGHHIFYLSAR